MAFNNMGRTIAEAPNTASLIPRLFTSTNNSPTEPDTRGNPALKPELATGIDVAYEKFWGKGAVASISANMRRLSDYTHNALLLTNGRWVSLPLSWQSRSSSSFS